MSNGRKYHRFVSIGQVWVRSQVRVTSESHLNDALISGITALTIIETTRLLRSRETWLFTLFAYPKYPFTLLKLKFNIYPELVKNIYKTENLILLTLFNSWLPILHLASLSFQCFNNLGFNCHWLISSSLIIFLYVVNCIYLYQKLHVRVSRAEMIRKVAHKDSSSRFKTRPDGNSYAATVHVDVDLRSINLKSFSLVEAAI